MVNAIWGVFIIIGINIEFFLRSNKILLSVHDLNKVFALFIIFSFIKSHLLQEKF